MSSLISEETVAFVKGVAAEVLRVETPCGDGHMIWHVWGETHSTPGVHHLV
jgi:hypothetical protein